jgi:CheY-like chemotaxis protein
MEPQKTILVVDDDPDFHVLVRLTLMRFGYCIKSMYAGKLNLISRIARTCDLILLDIELPGANGVDVGKKLKSDPETSEIPIIMISGHSDGLAMFHDSGANAFIQKPLSIIALVKKVKELAPDNEAVATN